MTPSPSLLPSRFSVKLLAKIGWRNIWRNKRRSLITIGAMAFSLMLMVVLLSLLAGNLHQVLHNITAVTTGDLQIHHKNYLSDQNLYQTIPESPRLLAALQAKGFFATPRSYGYGLVSSESAGKAAGVRIEGISLDQEAKVTELHRPKHLSEGHYLTGKTLQWKPPAVENSTPAFEDPLSGTVSGEESEPPLIIGEVVLGKKLARTLKVKTGDRVLLVTMAADGSVGNELFQVAGILANLNEESDRSLALMDQAGFRRLFALPPDEVHEIAVRLPENAPFEDVKATIAAVLGPHLEVKTWQELLPAVADILRLASSMNWLTLLIMYLGAGMVIMNSVLMMVLERIPEFGVMKALGIRPVQLFGLIVWETFWMCVLAGVAGLGAGVPLTIWLSTHGIDLSAFAPSGFQVSGAMVDPVLRTYLTVHSVTDPLVALFGISLLAVLYPAGKAAIIKPVEALTAL